HRFSSYIQKRFRLLQGEGIQARGITGGENQDIHEAPTVSGSELCASVSYPPRKSGARWIGHSANASPIRTASKWSAAKGRRVQLAVESMHSLGPREFALRATVGHIKRIDRRTALGADAGEGDINFIAAEALQQVVQESDSIRRLDFNQSEVWIRLVVDADMRRELQICDR